MWRSMKIPWPIALGLDMSRPHVAIFWGSATMVASHCPKIYPQDSAQQKAPRYRPDPWRFLRGPRANARQEDLDDLAAAGRGDTVPSVVGFKAVKKDRSVGGVRKGTKWGVGVRLEHEAVCLMFHGVPYSSWIIPNELVRLVDAKKHRFYRQICTFSMPGFSLACGVRDGNASHPDINVVRNKTLALAFGLRKKMGMPQMYRWILLHHGEWLFSHILIIFPTVWQLAEKYTWVDPC